MKRGVLIALLVILAALPVLAGTNGPVCIVTVREDISRNTLFLLRRAVKEASDRGAAALVIEMDTNGGSLKATEDILQLLQHVPVKTYTFVNTKAYSAGAIIASATDKIYMAPGGVIGAATPILVMPGQGLEEMPAAEREKMNSATRALVRATAQQKGHNPAVFEAMVDKDLGLTVAGTNVVEKGKLVTLTVEEAVRLYGEPPVPLLAAGKVGSVGELLAQVGLGGAATVPVKPYGFELLARWITLISPLLIMVGMIAIWMELKAPGLGVPTVVAVAAFGLYFLGYFAAGMAGWEEVALFGLGVILLLVEVFVIPVFGVAGIAGIVAIAAALLMAMVEHWPGTRWPDAAQWQAAIVRLSLGVGGTVVAGALLARWLPKTVLFQHWELGKTLSAAEGYTSSKATLPGLLGATGVAETVLRPAGKGRFGEQLVDVVTEGDFIQKGERIRIVAVEGARVVVTKWNSN